MHAHSNFGFRGWKKNTIRIFLIKYRDCFWGGKWYHTFQSSSNEIESFYQTDYFVYLIQTHLNGCYYIFKNIKMILYHYVSLYFTKMSLTHQSQPVCVHPLRICVHVSLVVNIKRSGICDPSQNSISHAAQGHWPRCEVVVHTFFK